RRRHTRFSRDWSSDVCSSDLTAQAIFAGNYPQEEQRHLGELKAAPKLYRENGQIDWRQPTVKIHNLIRGLSPFPSAWTNLNGLRSEERRVGKLIRKPAMHS